MPYKCTNCDYREDEFKEECPKCGGYLEEVDPAIDWEGEGVEEEERREKEANDTDDHPSDEEAIL